MDTRTKLIAGADARTAAKSAIVVSGYFDPLLASHAGRLEELKRDGAPLMVVILDPPRAILPSRARAELVAGLRAVDYVVEGADAIAPHVHLEEEDAVGLEKLIRHVHARQRAAS